MPFKVRRKIRRAEKRKTGKQENRKTGKDGGEKETYWSDSAGWDWV